MTRYLTLAEYLVIAELTTGFAAEDLARSGRLDHRSELIDLNGGQWEPEPTGVDEAEAERTMVAVAAGAIGDDDNAGTGSSLVI